MRATSLKALSHASDGDAARRLFVAGCRDDLSQTRVGAGEGRCAHPRVAYQTCRHPLVGWWHTTTLTEDFQVADPATMICTPTWTGCWRSWARHLHEYRVALLSRVRTKWVLARASALRQRRLRSVEWVIVPAPSHFGNTAHAATSSLGASLSLLGDHFGVRQFPGT